MQKKKAAKAKGADEDVDPAFAPLVAHHMKSKGVAHATMFNSKSLCVNKKVFAMINKGDLVVKTSAEHVAGLIAAKVGKPWGPGPGRVMKEWVAIPKSHQKSWLEISKRAKDFVASL